MSCNRNEANEQKCGKTRSSGIEDSIVLRGNLERFPVKIHLNVGSEDIYGRDRY